MARPPKSLAALAGEPKLWREAQAKVATLSRREMEILVGLVAGQTNPEIAASLGISFRTVEVHRYNMREKLGERTTNGAARVAIYAALAEIILADAEGS